MRETGNFLYKKSKQNLEPSTTAREPTHYNYWSMCRNYRASATQLESAAQQEILHDASEIPCTAAKTQWSQKKV